MRIVSRAILLALLVLPAACGGKEDRGTAEEAQALVDKAVARFQEVGAETAFAEVSDAKGPFVDRDLYIFVIGPDEKIVAHGADQSLIGTDTRTLKDADGKEFGIEILGATPEGIWVDYKWANPVSKEIEPKSSFVKKVDGYVFGSGYYKS